MEVAGFATNSIGGAIFYLISAVPVTIIVLTATIGEQIYEERLMMNRIFKAEEMKAVRAAVCARFILRAENAWKGGLMSRYNRCPG